MFSYSHPWQDIQSLITCRWDYSSILPVPSTRIPTTRMIFTVPRSLRSGLVRYYILDLDGLKPLVEAAVGIGSHSDAYGPEDDDKDSGGLFEYWLGVGGTYFLNNNVGIDLGIGYSSTSYKYKSEDDGDENYKYVYGGVYFNLGVVVMLGK